MTTDRRRTLLTFPAALLVLVGASCRLTNPAAEITMGQTVIELTEAVNALRFEAGVMQEQIDSLRLRAARQDSAIARLSR